MTEQHTDGGKPSGQGAPQPAPKFNPEAPHQRRPKLRPVRGFPVKHENQVLLGLADVQQISDKILYTSPAAQAILPHLNGRKELDSIVAEVGRGLTRPMLETLVAQLDAAGLLEGPNFDALLRRVHEDYESKEHLPPGASGAFADAVVNLALSRQVGAPVSDEERGAHAPAEIAKQLDEWIGEALKDVTDPSFDRLPRAVFAPHIDYPRGWQGYSHVYGRLRVVDRPDRLIILGTNHFGAGTGVTGCDRGFETPLGVCRVAEDALDALKQGLGPENARRLLANRYDHEREHSIEAQLLWAQHVFGPDESGEFPRALGILVHDPAVKGGESYDGNGLGFQPFVDALRTTLADLPGRTLLIASADLSHVGPQHGDPKPLAGTDPEPTAARNRVLNHDREMLDLVAKGKSNELVASMAWMQNPTRWCSIGNIAAAMQATDAGQVRLLQYGAAMDGAGLSLVSCFAGAIF